MYFKNALKVIFLCFSKLPLRKHTLIFIENFEKTINIVFTKKMIIKIKYFMTLKKCYIYSDFKNDHKNTKKLTNDFQPLLTSKKLKFLLN